VRLSPTNRWHLRESERVEGPIICRPKQTLTAGRRSRRGQSGVKDRKSPKLIVKIVPVTDTDSAAEPEKVTADGPKYGVEQVEAESGVPRGRRVVGIENRTLVIVAGAIKNLQATHRKDHVHGGRYACAVGVANKNVRRSTLAWLPSTTRLFVRLPVRSHALIERLQLRCSHKYHTFGTCSAARHCRRS